ncbi:MAG TPA: hypothetical protein VFS24_09710 [Steroidobacteraceae bacterium]|nr:hypothetical protein [Steroidobacteraceae bacterium]
MPRLPQKDKITFRWLIDHVPISWWAIATVALASAFSAGVGLGRISFQNLDGDIREKITIRDKLQSEVQGLSTKKAVLQNDIAALEVQRRVQQMSSDQVREELKKKWTRD